MKSTQLALISIRRHGMSPEQQHSETELSKDLPMLTENICNHTCLYYLGRSLFGDGASVDERLCDHRHRRRDRIRFLDVEDRLRILQNRHPEAVRQTVGFVAQMKQMLLVNKITILHV